MTNSNSNGHQENSSGIRSIFPVKVPEYFNFAYDVVDRWAASDRNKLAMIWTNQEGAEKKFTFYDFSKLSNQAANFLISLGIGKGDRVMIMLPRVPEWWIFSLALQKLGAIQCPNPVLLTPADLQQRIGLGRFKMVITDAENAPKFDEIFNNCPTLHTRLLIDGERPGWASYTRAIQSQIQFSRHEVKVSQPVKTRSDDPLLLVFTSGTSKTPKMVLHKCSYPLGHLITAKLWHGLTANDLHFTVSDTGWAKNLWGNFFGQWYIGACLFIYDIRGKFHANEILPLLERYAITSFCAPPTVYRMLVLADLSKFDFKELRNCTSAGESIQTETVKLWKEGTGLTIREGYGQTETVCMLANFVDIPNRPGALGQPSPGWNIELHDDDGQPVAAGEEGRLAVGLKPQPPIGLMECYLNNPEENERSFVGDYYYTGDKAYCDKDGYYYFMGRSDDIIKSSGYRIGPSEVEEVMMRHPAVREVAVIGVPDQWRGARIKAYITLNPGYEPTEALVSELQNHAKRLTAPYKYPREIAFMPKMPKTFSGKIKRDLLRLHAATGEAPWLHEQDDK